tara:strand:- start:1351 stop:1665 length:315 start_codon:yes stop_codon:yes gene_type:complete
MRTYAPTLHVKIELGCLPSNSQTVSLTKGRSFVPDDDCNRSGDQWEARKTHIAGSLTKTSNSQQQVTLCLYPAFWLLDAGAKPQASSAKLDKHQGVGYNGIRKR